MTKCKTERRQTKRRLEKRSRRRRILEQRAPRMKSLRRSLRISVGLPLHESPHSGSARPSRSAVQFTAIIVLCAAGAFCLSVPACGGTRPRPLSFREQSVEITSVPQDAVFYLNDVQDTPLANTGSVGQVLSAVARHPYGEVRYQTGRQGDPWGFVGNEEDRGSALSDFHARPYRPELGTFMAVDPQSLLQPEKIIGQPSRMLPYAYAAGSPVSNHDKDGLDYIVAVEGNQIHVTMPVQLYGAATSQDLEQLKSSFVSEWGERTFAYEFGKTKYSVDFRLDAKIATAPMPKNPAEGMNYVRVVRGDNVGVTEKGNKILGGAKCEVGGTCRTATLPSDRLADGLTVPHEFGHLMGLAHEKSPQNLMYFSNDGPAKKSILNDQVGAILGRAMFQMPDGAKSFQTTIVAKPFPER